jgi:hypothetical protein
VTVIRYRRLEPLLPKRLRRSLEELYKLLFGAFYPPSLLSIDHQIRC